MKNRIIFQVIQFVTLFLYQAKGQVNISVTVGNGKVTFLCSYDGASDFVSVQMVNTSEILYRYDTGASSGNEGTTTYVGRIQSVSYSAATRQFQLTLTNLSLLDSGQYVCVSEVTFNPNINSDTYNIEILEDARRVGVIFEVTCPLEDGSHIELTCFANNAKPAPSLTWMKFIQKDQGPWRSKLFDSTENVGDQLIFTNSSYTGAYSTNRTLSVTVYKLGEGEKIKYECQISNVTMNLNVRTVSSEPCFPNKGSNDGNKYKIILGVVGGIVLIALLVGGGVLLWRWKRH